jgi:hypothetical protein
MAKVVESARDYKHTQGALVVVVVVVVVASRSRRKRQRVAKRWAASLDTTETNAKIVRRSRTVCCVLRRSCSPTSRPIPPLQRLFLANYPVDHS